MENWLLCNSVFFNTQHMTNPTMSFLLSTEFVLMIKIPPFYEVNSFDRKWQAHGGISKIFFLDHFSPSFLGQKC